MEGTMKVCVLTGQRQLEWTEREIPQPAAGELQIKLEFRFFRSLIPVWKNLWI